MKNETIDELDSLAARARRDTDVEAVVLVTAGTLSCLTVAINLATSGPTGQGVPEVLHGVGSWVLAPLVPVALVGVWLFLRRRESRRGVGRQSRVVGWAALWVAVLFFVGVGPILTYVLGPYPVLMGLLVLAGIRFGSRLLLVWGLVAGLLGLLVGMFQFNNRLGLPVMDTAVGVAIAVSTLAAGVVVAVRARRV
jgi:hypothetical protein